MADKARSHDAQVQAQLDRLTMLSPGRDVLGLERITALLDRLGNPHHRMPPVFHVAGTNGKGSTCAFLRAGLEAAGHRVHVYSSPHLVRFNERIRVAGTLIDDAVLAPLLAEVLDVADGLQASFFEITTAAAFLAFARTPADACVIEVGLGGRLDATNVIAQPLVTGIAQLGIDHEGFLLSPEPGVPANPMERIAFEKSGIAKAGRPLVTMVYDDEVAETVNDCASRAGADWFPCGDEWGFDVRADGVLYGDKQGELVLPMPGLAGPHQIDNAMLAVAMLRHQDRLAVPVSALITALENTRWPARLQTLSSGPIRDLLPATVPVLLDGAHNPAAAALVADHIRATLAPGQKLHLVTGMLANKDPKGVLAYFRGLASSVYAVPVPEHNHHVPDALAAIATGEGMAGIAAPDVASALAAISGAIDPAHPPFVLIMGSLYLAGVVLDANNEWPV
jgi:dihydrofolate synthase/folylpolyglutamate synthase